jgi:hypothetical protein
MALGWLCTVRDPLPQKNRRLWAGPALNAEGAKLADLPQKRLRSTTTRIIINAKTFKGMILSRSNRIIESIYSSSFSTRRVGEYNKVHWRTDASSWGHQDIRSTVPSTGDTEYRKIRLLGGYFSAIKIVIIRSVCVRSFCLFIPFCPPNDEIQLHSTTCLVN